MDLSVIILNWNTCALLEKCLHSLLDCPSEVISVEVIVVDNASEDNSRAMVTEKFPQVKLIVSKKNVGFGAGNNLALPEARGTYLLFLNSDTIVHHHALQTLVEFANNNPDAGIIGAKLLNADGSLQYSCRHYPNLATGLFRNTPLGRLFPGNKFNTDYLMSSWDHATPRDVDWVSGAALMIRRSVVDQTGCFDEEYYMYCEDVDLCYRVKHAPRQKQGVEETWRVVYCPDAVITHYIGKSSDKVPTRMTYEFHRSQYLFYTKHYRAKTPVIMRPLVPVGIGLRAVGQLTRYRIKYWRRKLSGPRKKTP